MKRCSKAGRAIVIAMTLVVVAATAAEAKSGKPVQITLSDMIRWKRNAGEGCTIFYAVENKTRRHIGEIVLSFSGPDGQFFTDKIYDIRRGAKVDRFHGESKDLGGNPPSAVGDCHAFAKALIDIVDHRHGPTLHSCVIDKIADAVCPTLVDIRIGPRFLDNAAAADRHPQQ